MFKKISKIILIIFLCMAQPACDGNSSAPFNNSALNNNTKYLYVSSGSCYGGGVATSAGPTNSIARYSLDTGALINVVVDYNKLFPGDSPVSITEYDADNFLVLVENTAGRRVDLVNKTTGSVSSYIINGTALSAVLRSLVLLSDFSLLVSKSSAIEKFNSSKIRITSGANPYVNAPAAPCATSTTLISSVTTSASGKIVYTHAAASPNNRIGVIKTTGYAVAADCLAGQAGPVTTALPTRAIFHSGGKLLVSYGSTTAASNVVYSYDFDDSTGALSNATSIFSDSSIVNGPSTMVEDTETGDVFVANVISTFNTIERFSFSSNTLTRLTTTPFIPADAYTRCVSDMKVME